MKTCFAALFALLAFFCGHSSAADFPTLDNSEPDTNAAPPSVADSLAKMKLPPSFKATVFAAEPDVQNPIALARDSRRSPHCL